MELDFVRASESEQGAPSAGTLPAAILLEAEAMGEAEMANVAPVGGRNTSNATHAQDDQSGACIVSCGPVGDRGYGEAEGDGSDMRLESSVQAATNIETPTRQATSVRVNPWEHVNSRRLQHGVGEVLLYCHEQYRGNGDYLLAKVVKVDVIDKTYTIEVMGLDHLDFCAGPGDLLPLRELDGLTDEKKNEVKGYTPHFDTFELPGLIPIGDYFADGPGGVASYRAALVGIVGEGGLPTQSARPHLPR